MKKVIIVLFLFIIVMSILGLIGCSQKTESYMDFDFEETFYISESQNRIPYPFAFHEKVNKVEVTNLTTSNNSFVDVLFEVDETPITIKGYYMSGVVFSFQKIENVELKSFTILINDYYLKDITLNLNIKSYNETSPNILYPLSIPMICNLNETLTWKFKSTNEIKIIDINLVASSIDAKKIEIGNQEFNAATSYRLNKNTEIEITITPDYKNSKTKLSCGYLYVEYMINEEKHVFNTELTSFNSEIKILENKLGGKL